MELKIIKPKVMYDHKTGVIEGEHTVISERTMEDVKDIFKDHEAALAFDKDTVVYRVICHFEEEQDKEGGLFFGTSYILPGKVGNEYFMTKGHFHKKMDRAEYYWCLEGKGCLILMDEDRNCWAEEMEPGTLHYIPGNIAHRIANTGDKILVVGACWPSDAGHDYESIAEMGFSARLLDIDHKAVLVKEDGDTDERHSH